MTVPLLFAALGETIVQRSGVINVGLEGMVLTGALAAVLGVWQTQSPTVGLLCAVITAGLFSLIFALFAVKLAANQVVVGVVINLMALGITGTISRQAFGRQQTFVAVAGLTHLFANQTILTPIALLCVPGAWWWMFRTRGGLELRAAGEQPQAAEAAGVNVLALRTRAILFGGIMAGIAGACLTLGDVPTFQEGMSAGRGFIALAIVTAGRWNPYGCLLASLVFGVSEELEIQGQAMGLHVPHDILLAAPYIMTLIILMSGSKFARAPAALCLPYRRA